MLGLLFGQIVDHDLQVAVAFGKGRTLGPHIGVVKAIERHAEDLEHLEGDICLHPRQIKAVTEPRPVKGLPAERVAAGPGETVPIGHGKAQVVLHPLAEDHLVGVVMAEGKLVATVCAFKPDRRDILEKLGHVRSLSRVWAARKRA